LNNLLVKIFSMKILFYCKKKMFLKYMTYRDKRQIKLLIFQKKLLRV